MLKFVIFFYALHVVAATDPASLKNIQQAYNEYKSWRQVPHEHLKQFLENSDLHRIFSNHPESLVVNVDSRVSNNSLCADDLAQWILDYTNGEYYAERMLDSFGRRPSGTFTRNFKWLGAYDQCVTTEAVNSQGQEILKPQYCAAGIISKKIVSFPFKTSIGTCVPMSCNEVQIQDFFQKALGPLSYVKVKCSKSKVYDSVDIIATVICVTLLSVGLIGSVYDGLAGKTEHKMKGKVHHLLLAFSIPRNAQEVLNSQVRNKSLACLNGMRVISMAWIVLCHGLRNIMYFLENPSAVWDDYFNSIWFQALANSTVAVDTFFCMSGFLVTYFTMDELYTKKGRMNWFLYYFHRVWKLTPLLAFVILMSISLATLPWRGPGDFSLDDDAELVSSCTNYWWSTVLYINNFYPRQGCIGVTWFLANDMQFFCISPVILYAWYKNRKVGFIIWSLLLLMCWVVTGIVSKSYNLSPIRTHISDDVDVGSHVSMRPYYRIGSYLVGMLLGFLMIDPKFKNLKLNMPVALIGWGASIVTGLWIIYGVFRYVEGGPNDEIPMDPNLAAFYLAVHRTAWAASVAWIIFACSKGYGGYINSLLSYHGFAPLARLCYGVFLTHYLIMAYFNATQKFTIFYSYASLSFYFCGYLVYSFAVAFICSVMVESPIMGLKKVFLITPKPPGKNGKPLEIITADNQVISNDTKL